MAYLRPFAGSSKVERGLRKLAFGHMRSKVGRIQLDRLKFYEIKLISFNHFSYLKQ